MTFTDQKKDIVAIALSALFHAALALALLSADGLKSDEQELSVEIITLHDVHPNSENTVFVSQKKKRSVKKPTSDETSAIAEAKKEEATQDTLKPDVAIGDSDIESSLRGRAPANEIERYLAEVRDQVARQQKYPAPSRAFHEEGTVRIRLTLDQSGSLVKIELVEESLSKRLNDAAVRAASKASPFRSFPNEIKFKTWKITLPVRFVLAQN